MFCLEHCDLCGLSESTSPVMADNQLVEGKMRVFLLGEAPGADEERIGKPFVGRAGKLLRQCLKDANIDSYYISNTCYCRPPGNRNPTQQEIAACGGFTIAELNHIRPDLIITLGGVATEFMARMDGRRESISYTRLRKLSGFMVPNPTDEQVMWCVSSVYHPAYILRNRRMLDAYIYSLRAATTWAYESLLMGETRWPKK